MDKLKIKINKKIFVFLFVLMLIGIIAGPTPAEVRSRRPFRGAKINVSEVDGEAGWYRVDLNVRPHFKFMGANFELSLVGKLDKE